jgi:hypothetical protein
MKQWLKNLWGSSARKYLIIGLLAATGIGAPVAVSVGTAVDQGISEIEAAE